MTLNSVCRKEACSKQSGCDPMNTVSATTGRLTLCEIHRNTERSKYQTAVKTVTKSVCLLVCQSKNVCRRQIQMFCSSGTQSGEFLWLRLKRSESWREILLCYPEY